MEANAEVTEVMPDEDEVEEEVAVEAAAGETREILVDGKGAGTTTTQPGSVAGSPKPTSANQGIITKTI